MPARYKIYGGEHDGEWGSLIKIDKERVTVKLDNGEIVTDPPHHAYYQGSISDRQLKKVLARKP